MKKTHKWLGVALCAMAFGGSAQAQKLMVVEMQDNADNWSCALSKILAATFLNGQVAYVVPTSKHCLQCWLATPRLRLWPTAQ